MIFLSNPRFIVAMRVLFWLALLFAVTMAILPTPPTLAIERFGDKFAHMLAFSTLAGLAALGYPQAWRWRIAERLSFAGALIEVVQAIPGLGRDCDIKDWVADTIAIVAVTLIAGAILSRLREESPQAG
jgi:VanZ family protein